jgi:hypothetical protein
MQAQTMTAAELEGALAAARARLDAIPGELAEAEAEAARLYEGWLQSKELVAAAGRVLLGASTVVQVAGEYIIRNGYQVEERDPEEARQAERRSRQAHAGLDLAREEEGAAVKAYQRLNQRCGALLAERNQLEYRVSVWERELARTQQRQEVRGVELAEARGWLDKVRTGLLGARA